MILVKTALIIEKFFSNALTMRNIGIFASGNGTNAQALINRFAGRPDVRIALIITDNPRANVIGRAHHHRIPCLVLRNSALLEEHLVQAIKTFDIALFVLAGYLSLVPESFIHAFSGKIINLHPALLPNFGGKGMYGMRVHQAVIESGATESGITIHWVNEHYDRGETIFQATCRVDPADTPESLAEKIHTLEHQHLPEVVERLVKE